MFQQIMQSVGFAFAAPLDWFIRVISSLGAQDIYLGIIFLVLTAGFLLKPLRGGGSDKAKKSNDDNEGSDDE